MEELKLKFYFEHMDEFSEKEIFENCEYVWEPLNKTKEYLNKKIVEPNIKENKAEVGEFVSISGNYSIGEGTKIGANVTIIGPVTGIALPFFSYGGTSLIILLAAVRSASEYLKARKQNLGGNILWK